MKMLTRHLREDTVPERKICGGFKVSNKYEDP